MAVRALVMARFDRRARPDRAAGSIAAIVLLIACAAPRGGVGEETGSGAPTEAEPVRVLALGDSYTIGEGVAPAERWPAQLAALLRGQGVAVEAPHIIARTGWTTDELDAAITAAAPGTLGSDGRLRPYDLVTLLIGVNNQYRGRGIDEYRAQLTGLLRRAVGFAGGDARRVIVLSIPDWGATPFAEGRDRDRIALEIDAFNAVKRAETARAGARFVDVTPLSRDARTDAELLASDRLHPSGAMYGRWAALALPEARAALGR